MLMYVSGIELQLDDDEEFEFDSIAGNASAGVSPILDGDIDFDTNGTAFFSDVDDLPTVFSDLNAPNFSFPNRNSTSSAYTEFFDGQGAVTGMEFGPPPVPEPSTVVLFVVGILGILGVRYRGRKRAG
jgi:hypothetical protein